MSSLKSQFNPLNSRVWLVTICCFSGVLGIVIPFLDYDTGAVLARFALVSVVDTIPVALVLGLLLIFLRKRSASKYAKAAQKAYFALVLALLSFFVGVLIASKVIAARLG